MNNFAPIIATNFNKFRPQIKKLLHKLHDYASVDDIYIMCCTGQKYFFSNENSWAVIEVIENPNYLHLNVQLAGGTEEGLKELWETNWCFAKAIGAKKITFVGRKGLARTLKKYGWKAPCVYMEKEI